MGDLEISYFLYFPKFIYCLFAFHGALSSGNSPGRARSGFERAVQHRPRIKLTIRQPVVGGSALHPIGRQTADTSDVAETMEILVYSITWSAVARSVGRRRSRQKTTHICESPPDAIAMFVLGEL
jgi:hypothetical protein